MKSPRYRAVRLTDRKSRTVLSVHEVARVIATGDSFFLSDLWHTKRTLPERAAPLLTVSSELRDRMDGALLHLHLDLLERMGVTVGPERMVQSAKHRLVGALRLAGNEPVALFVGNGESSVYREGFTQALMLLTGHKRCLESSLAPTAAGGARHTAIYRAADDAMQSALIALVRDFFTIRRCHPSKAALLRASALSERTARLRSESALSLVTALDRAKARRSRLDVAIDELEEDVLRRMRGAGRAILRDGSELTVTNVHRDAHYVTAADYVQLRHIHKE